MVAASTDYFCKVGSPGQATTLSAPGHASGGVSINVDSTSLWPTDTGVIFAIDTTTLVAGVETRVAGSYTVWEGVVTSGTSIGSMVLKEGTDQNYSAGATTRVYILPTSSRENRMVDGLLIEHKQTGKHSDITADSLVIADGGNIEADHILEAASAHGVVIDGLLIKDSKLATNDSVVTANITDANVTIPKIVNPYRFSAYKSSAQTVNNAATNKVLFETEEFDVNNNFATSTYTAPVTGLYFINANIGTDTVASGTRRVPEIYVDGAAVRRGNDFSTGTQTGSCSVTAIVPLTAGNTVDIYLTSIGANQAITVDQKITYFQGYLICTT